MKLKRVFELLWENCGRSVMMTTAFGPTGLVMMYHIKDICPELPIYFIDTHKQFEETLKLRDRIKEEWTLNIITVSSPIIDSLENSDECCRLRKVDVLNNILKDYDIWLTGIRQDQTKLRKKTKFVEYVRGVIKFAPCFKWTSADIWTYIREHKIPYNPLLDQGYASVGCTPCTSKGKYREESRWSGSDKLECGIHL